MTTFRIYWLAGKIEVVSGDSIADAVRKAGYGGGAASAIDYYEEVKIVMIEAEICEDARPSSPATVPDAFASVSKYAVFYALKDKIIEAVLEDGSIRDKVGARLILMASSLGERESAGSEVSGNACLETREYKVVATKVFEGDGKFGGDDGIDRVLEDRDWEEGRVFENKDFFDWYYAANILGLISKPREFLPLTGSIIVELE